MTRTLITYPQHLSIEHAIQPNSTARSTMKLSSSYSNHMLLLLLLASYAKIFVLAQISYDAPPVCLSQNSWANICLTLDPTTSTCGSYNGTRYVTASNGYTKLIIYTNFSEWYHCTCFGDGNANTGHCARSQGNGISPVDAQGANYLYNQTCSCLCDVTSKS